MMNGWLRWVPLELDGEFPLTGSSKNDLENERQPTGFGWRKLFEWFKSEPLESAELLAESTQDEVKVIESKTSAQQNIRTGG